MAKFSAIYKKDFNNQLNYDIIGRFSNEFRTDNSSSQVIGNNITETENATPYTINQNLSYFYTANENNIFALEVQHQLQDEDPFYAASLENDPTDNTDGFDPVADELGFDTNVQQYLFNQDRRVQSNQLDAKLDYYYILNKKSNLNFVGGTILSKQNFDSRFFQTLDNGSDFNPSPTIQGVTNPSTTNDTEYSFSDFYAGLRYRLKSGIFTFTPGFTAHAYNFNNTQLGTSFKDSFQTILPELNVVAQFKRSESLTFDYRQQVNFTDVTAIAEGLVANSYNGFFTGNNDLQNARTHRLSLRYSNFNLFNNTSTFAGIFYNKAIDQISGIANFIPGSVVSTSSNLNIPFQTENLSSFASFSKTIRKIQGRIRGNYNYSKNYQFFGGNKNEIKSNRYSITPSINTNFTKAPNVTLSYGMSFVDQLNTNIDSNLSNEFSTITYAPKISFDAYVWDSLTIRTDFTYNEVRREGELQNLFKIWDFTLAYRKDRDAKWEYELVGSNLLGTDSRANVNAGNISNSINETFILPRFISLRARYQL